MLNNVTILERSSGKTVLTKSGLSLSGLDAANLDLRGAAFAPPGPGVYLLAYVYATVIGLVFTLLEAQYLGPKWSEGAFTICYGMWIASVCTRRPSALTVCMLAQAAVLFLYLAPEVFVFRTYMQHLPDHLEVVILAVSHLVCIALICLAVSLISSKFPDSNTMNDADFSGATLSSTLWKGRTVRQSKFSRADISHSDVTSSNFDNCIFIGSNLSDSQIFDCDISHSTLDTADVESTRFVRTRINLCQICNINFIGTQFDQCKLNDCNLSGSKFLGVDLSTSKLESCTFTGAHADQATKWPSGFDPISHGIVFLPI